MLGQWFPTFRTDSQLKRISIFCKSSHTLTINLAIGSSKVMWLSSMAPAPSSLPLWDDQCSADTGEEHPLAGVIWEKLKNWMCSLAPMFSQVVSHHIPGTSSCVIIQAWTLSQIVLPLFLAAKNQPNLPKNLFWTPLTVVCKHNISLKVPPFHFEDKHKAIPSARKEGAETFSVIKCMELKAQKHTNST